jgi:hypothetical protein
MSTVRVLPAALLQVSVATQSMVSVATCVVSMIGCQSYYSCANFTVEIGHFPSCPWMEIRKP